MPNFFTRLEDKFWDKVDPPVKSVLKTRDPCKARSRRGENGSGLTRRERAANLENEALQTKLTNAQRKLGRNVGGIGGSGAKAAVTVKALHWHLTPKAVLDASANTWGAGKQIARYNDYEKEALARGEQHRRDEARDGTIGRDMLDGLLGRSDMSKRVQRPGKAADNAQKIYNHNHQQDTTWAPTPTDCELVSCLFERSLLLIKCRPSPLHVF